MEDGLPCLFVRMAVIAVCVCISLARVGRRADKQSGGQVGKQVGCEAGRQPCVHTGKQRQASRKIDHPPELSMLAFSSAYGFVCQPTC